MTTDDIEPVAGPSHGNSHVMQMTSQLRLCSMQRLQPPAVCLPVSVQQLTYDGGGFHDGDDEDDAGADADGDELLKVGSSSLCLIPLQQYQFTVPQHPGT